MKGKRLIIFIVLFFASLAFLSIKNSFQLALGGDDWGIHYLIYQLFDKRDDISYFNPFTYFCTYCPHYFFLSIISRIFGYEPFYYFLASLLAKTVAALGVFLLVKKFTKSVMAAFLAGIFMSITYLGIEATDWAFNYNYFLGIGVVSAMLIWYWKAKESGRIKDIFVAGLLVSASFVISPARMHGLIPLLLIAETGWFIIEGRKFNFKKAALRLVVAAFFFYSVLYGVSNTYYFIRDNFNFEIGPFYVGDGYGSAAWNMQRIKDGLTLLSQKISAGQSDVLIDPIATVGNYVMPDRLWVSIPFSKITLLGRPAYSLVSYLLPISLTLGAISYFILKATGLKGKKALLYILNLAAWSTFIYFLHKSTISSFSYERIAFAIVGGFSLIFSVWFFFLLKKSRPLLAHTLLVSWGWMFTPILFPWIISPYGVIWTWGRYSIQQGAGLAVWMAVIFAFLIITLRKKGILLGIILVSIFSFTFMHIKFSNDHLGQVVTYRSKEIDSANWQKITSDVPSIDESKLNIFLLLTDLQSTQIAEALRFGFYGRASVYYKTSIWDHSPFMVVNEYESVLSSVYDGKYLAKQGRQTIPTSIDHIYAFALQNKQMINVTDEVRKKLKTDLEAVKQGTRPLPQPVL